MRKIIFTLNSIIALYFFGLANIFFWGGLLGSFAEVAVTAQQKSTPNFLPFLFGLIAGPLLIGGTIMFFRKSMKKYKYGMILLGIILIIIQLYRFFDPAHYTLQMTDLKNFVWFGIPILAIYFIHSLDRKYSAIPPSPKTASE